MKPDQRDFEAAQQELRAAQERIVAAQERARSERERTKRRAIEDARLNRVFRAQPARYNERRRRIVTASEAARGLAVQIQTELRATGASLVAARTAFEQYTDPRVAATFLKDDAPFLLFPIRLETRFKTVDGRRQLWVRVFPDDCNFDTFEPVPSEDEVTNARRYWEELWQAGGIEDLERVAWRNLVRSVGAGRAAWLVNNYKPVSANKPTKTHPEDLILVGSSETPPTQSEAGPIATFWRAMWLAEGRRASTDAARAALRSAVGDARAAVIEKNAPVNFRQPPTPPLRRDQVQVSTVFLVFPPNDQIEIQRNSWSRPPRIGAWPDRFVLIAYPGQGAPFGVLGKMIPNPLIGGIDPAADASEQLQQQANGDLRVPEAMKWMLDFDRAVDIGMGFRVDLTNAMAQAGFDKIVVIGIKATSNAEDGREKLEELLNHHRYGAHGLAIVPQGTPTNNTEERPSGFSLIDEADATYNERMSCPEPPPPRSADWRQTPDGQWLAEWLGIDPCSIYGIPGWSRRDQAEARLMNTVLWPGTMGYWMDTMMNPVFSDDGVERSRQFFKGFVSGRGVVPAIRIGPQPYGILPTTAFSRMAWMGDIAPGAPATSPSARPRIYYERLRDVLKLAAEQWQVLARSTAMVGGPGDPYQILLNVIGLHPTSVQYAERFSERFDLAYNKGRLSTAPNAMSVADLNRVTEEARQLLQSYGVANAVTPEILRQFQFTHVIPLNGPLIDTVPLSEQAPIRPYAPNNQNYIDWLVSAAGESLQKLQDQTGFTESHPPTALLYLLLRYALLEAYFDATVQLATIKLNLTPQEVSGLRRQPSFVYVDPQAPDREGRLALLSLPDVRLTNDPNVGVGEHITQNLKTLAAAQRLREQIEALGMLAKVPTARLERVFAEHIDCCGYRLDAWRSGLVHVHLAAMRALQDMDARTPNRGILLGAYGWLLDVRARRADFTPKTAPDATLRQFFNRPDQSPLLQDPANGGFIHAPSLNHAVAAALLRSGYLANADRNKPDTFAVRLSSERIRRALSILDGMRTGQSLGALLGYQFERALHDRYRQGEVDQFIYELRKAFPLRTDRQKSTKRTPAEQRDPNSVEARDVVDGERLVDHVRGLIAAHLSPSYNFGITALPQVTDQNQLKAINAEVMRLLDTFDAVADLLMAEGVFQAVHGNYDRVAATLDVTAGANLPPEPDVIRTPSHGFQLTQRAALHLDPAAIANPRTGSVATPLSKAQAPLNAWLNAMLPPLAQIACKVTYHSNAGELVVRDVTLADLELQPIDALQVFRDESGADLVTHELRDRIVYALGRSSKPLDLDGSAARLDIDPRTTVAAPVSLCRAIPMIRSLRALISGSRALRPTDLMAGTEANTAADADTAIDRKRVDDVKTDLETLKTSLLAFKQSWATKLDDVTDLADRAVVVPQIDTIVNAGMDLLVRAAAFGIPLAGWRFLQAGRAQLAADMRDSLQKNNIDRWTAALNEYDALMAQYPSQDTDEKRFDVLERAERRVSTTATPRPATPDALRTTVQNKRAPFDRRLKDFKALYDQGVTALSKLLSDWRALLPSDAFDVVKPDLEPFERRMHVLAVETWQAIEAIINELDHPKRTAEHPKGRLPVAQTHLAAYGAAADPRQQVEELQDAAKALLGEGVTLIPDFGLGDEQADEVQNAVTDSPILQRYLKDTEHVDLPVDEWLYTCARVRDQMQLWERVTMLAEPLGLTEPSLMPLQLPYRPDDSWLAGKIPDNYPSEGERLLYTACFVRPYDKTQRQSGLLIDEWTEVIPMPEKVQGVTTRVPQQTTGIAFHFDRPNAEPPQTMLLVAPPKNRGRWEWDDILDAVNETIDLARIRGVEPAQLDATPLAVFLPATTTAASAQPVTIVANLYLNNVAIAAPQPIHD